MYSPGERFHDLDALRAFAMLLGIVLHGMLSFIPFPFWPAQDIHQQEIYEVFVALIHGFRMPLFFFLSGFFMMMLWNKRGAKGLIKNRAIRILIPLVVGTIIVTPFMWGIGIWGGAKKLQTRDSRPATVEATDVWSAAKSGDAEVVREFLAEGGDPNAHDDFGIALLSWATLSGNDQVVALLIENGVDVNSRDRENRIALHGAAFMGEVEITKQLIAAGSEINAVGSARDTPLDSLRDNPGALQWVGSMLNLKYDADEVKKGREEIKEILLEAGAKPGAEFPPNLKGIYETLAFAPVFQHLWFLHYLLWFSIVFLAFGALINAVMLPSFFIRAPFCLIWLVPLTFAGQKMMGNPLGPDTASGIFLWPPIFFYYGIFVLFGALCFGRDEFLQGTKSSWPVYLIFAGICGAAALMEIRDTWFVDWVRPLSAAIFVWMMCFGLTGAFRRFFTGENRKIRWLSDSAYWLYLAHLPIIMALQVLVSDWQIPSLVKLLLITVSTTAFLLVLYQWCIRYTFIGSILNGKKTRPIQTTKTS